VQKWLQQEKHDCEDSTMPEFVFCMNMVLPGPPYYHLVMYFAIDDLSALGLKGGSNDRHFSSPLERFLFGNSDEFRNNTLKFIPHVKEGSFLLKTAVGTKPFILGKYLDQRFIQGDRYLEVISDVGSSTTFQQLVKLTSNYVSFPSTRIRVLCITLHYIVVFLLLIYLFPCRVLKFQAKWHLF
jgi:hypothetical protein